ncbi:MAG: DUF1844 domain-containing protein [Deltaproteobacteria bacterium]|nr:DUF1844 domain-containing protein [Deltaproteobacteria bacterium]
MSNEEKGFIIKDKRSLDEEGRLREEEKDRKTEFKDHKKEDKTTEKKEDKERPPLPEINFNSLIFSLSSSALFHLGEIADPQTGKVMKDLPLAKHSIDTIAMLKDKTKGNLTEEESKFIENILTDLRWRYIKTAKEK